MTAREKLPEALAHPQSSPRPRAKPASRGPFIDPRGLPSLRAGVAAIIPLFIPRPAPGSAMDPGCRLSRGSSGVTIYGKGARPCRTTDCHPGP